MAKIQRISLGDRPSAVPGGGLPNINGGAAAITEAAGNAAETGYKIAANAEQVQADKLRWIAEHKQAVVNVVDAGRRAGHYQEDLIKYFDQFKQEFSDSPEKVPQQLLDMGLSLLDRQIEQTPNTQVGLEMAQRGNALLMALVREAHDWVKSRQTQKAKGDLDVQINQFTAVAEHMPTLQALSAHLDSADAKLGSQFANVLGKDAPERMQKMRAAAVNGWVHVKGQQDNASTFMVANALDSADPESPLVKYATADDRVGYRKATENAFEGSTKTREYEQIKRDISHGGEIAAAFSAGDPQFAGIVVAERSSIAQQRMAIEAKISIDTAQFKKLGIDPVGKTDTEIVAMLDDREKFINALDHANRRQISLTAQDDPASVGALMAQQNKALRSRNGKDMAAIAKQQTRLAVAVASERVSGGTAAGMFQTMALAMQTAADNQENLWGAKMIKQYHIPREAGIAEINRQLGGPLESLTTATLPKGFIGLGKAGPFANLPEETKIAIRLDYEAMFNEAIASKQPVDMKTTRRMALRAISYRTGKHIPGAD